MNRRPGCPDLDNQRVVPDRGSATLSRSTRSGQGRLAQLVRAAGLQPAGHRFESGSAHDLRVYPPWG